MLLTTNSTGEYTGEYTVVKTYRSTVKGIVGGFFYYNGCLYTGVKGEYCVRKMTLCDNMFDISLDGFIKSEYLPISDVIGTTQGIDVKGNDMYVFTDSRGYKVNVNNL